VDVGGTRRIDSASLRRTGRAGSSASAGFVAEEVQEARASALTGAAPLTAVDTILALQALPDSLDERRRGVKQGDETLSLLDEIRDGLLAGTIPHNLLNRLATATARHRDGFADPKLGAILAEIDLRARVELAKLEMAEKKVS
jgi:Class II flagellar assembly regulator